MSPACPYAVSYLPRKLSLPEYRIAATPLRSRASKAACEDLRSQGARPNEHPLQLEGDYRLLGRFIDSSESKTRFATLSIEYREPNLIAAIGTATRCGLNN
jgi:hypothetical protein